MLDSRTVKPSSATFSDEEPSVHENQASIEEEFALHCPSNVSSCALEGGDSSDPVPIIKEEPLEVDEETREQALRPGIATVIDLTEDDHERAQTPPHPQKSVSRPLPRNAPLDDHEFLSSCVHGSDGLVLRPGMVVEVNQIPNLYHASFLEIQFIVEKEGGIVIRGLPYTRTKFLRGQLPRFRNEVCLLLQVDDDDARTDEIQAAVEVPAANVIRPRTLRRTNTDFPHHRFSRIYASVEEIEREGSLTCRWKYRLMYQNSAARKSSHPPFEYILTHLRANEIKEDFVRVHDNARLNTWRGSKVRGGSYNKYTGRDLKAIEDLDKDLGEDSDREGKWIDKQEGQRYTMGDMFCGAGGTSLGAQQAGFDIRVACDIDRDACKTYENNFPHTDLRKEDIWKFIEEDVDWGGTRDYVDVLHLSPPCQFWSPAHTVAGKDDEANIAVLFSCHELIKKFRPRIFTLEQTFGILHPRFEHYFNDLIHGFTQHSYSIRWKVVNLLEWGLASRRNRLIMIGACPGESLPTFPRSTHARKPPPGSDLKPLTTVMDAMRKIPPNASMHEKRRRFWNKESWDPNAPLSRCITTHGGFGNHHYKAKRDFTLREYATMNGFPATYPFLGNHKKRQIGNAFPPCVVRVLYGSLLRWLENEDRVTPVEDQEMYDMEDEYEVFDSDIDNEVEIIGVKVKRRKSSDADSAIKMVNAECAPCIDPGQWSEAQRGNIVDVPKDSPVVAPNGSIIVIDDDNDIVIEILE